jgi:nucleoside-diphosphate-sugar epimerase
MSRKIIVAGAQGVIGRAAAIRLAAQPDTQIIGLSRREQAPIPDVEAVSVDLMNPEQVRERLGGVRDVTHVVFGAYIERRTAAEKGSFNVAILRNLLDVVEETSLGLPHVTLYQGGKAYGADLGPFKTPAREDDPRLMPPNFYYGQEDLLRERQKGKAWAFTALRPEAVCGFAVGIPMNLLMVIAVYASISKELGLPLRFRGTEAAYRALYQVSSADILAEATDWAGMATISGGSTCGRRLRRCMAWTSPTRCRCCWRPTWPTRRRCGTEWWRSTSFGSFPTGRSQVGRSVI